MVKASRRIDDVAISETSNGRLTFNIWKGNGYEETYQMEADTARFLFNRLGRSLGQLGDE